MGGGGGSGGGEGRYKLEGFENFSKINNRGTIIRYSRVVLICIGKKKMQKGARLPNLGSSISMIC